MRQHTQQCEANDEVLSLLLCQQQQLVMQWT